MKKKVCIIMCYFGKLPETISAFLYSCKVNSEFSWTIFTDCDVDNPPFNVHIVKTTLEDIKSLASEKLGMDIRLDTPYKLCDYKVAYGLIFEDYIKEYDFWGYGDIDVVYGDLKSFISDELLEKYDKIYPLGHLSLVRNTDYCRRLFMQEIEGTSSYQRVLKSDTSCFFDEDRGINEKMEVLGLKIYTKFDFADIDGKYKRFRMVDKKALKLTLPRFKYFHNLKENYKHQIFYFRKGHLFRRYLQNGNLIDEEFSYIHYRRKLELKWNENDEVMLITPSGLIGAQSVPDIEDITKYNGISENEPFVFLKYANRRIRLRFMAEFKDRIIGILGKSKTIRGLVRKIKIHFKHAEEK